MNNRISALIAFTLGTAFNVLIILTLWELWLPLGVVYALVVIHHYMRIARSIMYARAVHSVSKHLVTRS